MSSSKIQEYNLDPNMGLAKESTSQEILEKFQNGVAGVTAQTKKFTEIAQGSIAMNSSKTITGSGICHCYFATGHSNCTIIIDGVSISVPDSNNWYFFYFNESIVLKNSSYNAIYFVQT